VDSMNGQENKDFRGYKSPDDKKKYTTAVLIAIAIFFLLQLGGSRSYTCTYKGPDSSCGGFSNLLDHGVYQDGNIWFPANPKGSSDDETDIMKMSTSGKSKPEKVGACEIKSPWFLAEKELIWIISPEKIQQYKNGQVSTVAKNLKADKVFRPFFINGKPAVVGKRGADNLALVFDNGKWNQVKKLDVKSEDDSKKSNDANIFNESSTDKIEGLICGDRLFFFYKQGGSLYYWETSPESIESDKCDWKVLGKIDNSNWASACINGNPAIITSTFKNPLKGLKVEGIKKEGIDWKPFFLGSIGFSFEAYPYVGGGDKLYLLSKYWTGEIQLSEIQDGRVHKITHNENFIMKWIFVLVGVVIIIFLSMPFILTYIIKGFAEKHRIPIYQAGLGTAQFASIWKRGIARAIDNILVFIPTIPVYIYFYHKLMDVQFTKESLLHLLTESLAVFLGLFLWGVITSLVLIFLEGSYGQTPGKKIMGIRVAKASDLQNCGFIFAFIRNFLFFVDAIYNYGVGIACIAFTLNWQRVGDLAAKTVVVEVEHHTDS